MRGRALALPDRAGARAGMAGTLLVHGALVALAIAALPHHVSGPPVYAVELVAAPLPTDVRRAAPEAVPRPPAPELAPAPKPEAKPTKTAPAKPKPKAPERTAPKPKAVEPQASREPTPVTRSQAQPLPGETPSTGTDVATIKTPGLAFPFPEYLRNIMNQVLRRWTQPQNRALRAEVAFLILKDGSVKDIRFVTRSGNFAFDLEAQGAIEAAGNAQAFGPLPDGWDANVLPVTFVFEPRR